jgi:hypothetical protein
VRQSKSNLHSVYVFYIYLTKNSYFCHVHHKLIGFYNREEKCLQRGLDWVFKYSGLRFVFKGLSLHVFLSSFFRVTFREIRRNCIISYEEITIECCEYVSVLVIQYEKRTFLSSVILPYVACSAVPYIPTSCKRNIYQKTCIRHKMCILIFPTTFF